MFHETLKQHLGVSEDFEFICLNPPVGGGDKANNKFMHMSLAQSFPRYAVFHGVLSRLRLKERKRGSLHTQRQIINDIRCGPIIIFIGPSLETAPRGRINIVKATLQQPTTNPHSLSL